MAVPVNGRWGKPGTMKIVHFIYDDIHNPWCGGGGALRAHEINSRLSSRHQVTAFTGAYPGAKKGFIDGVRYVRLGVGRGYALSRISYSIIATFLAVFIPHDVLVNDFSVFAPVGGSFMSRGTSVTIIHHVLRRQNLVKYPVWGIIPLFIEWLFVRFSERIITVSPGTKDILIRMHVRNRNVTVIPNGIDPSLFKVPYSSGHYVLYLGRFDFFMKGIDTLLDAFSTLAGEWKDCPRLVMAGRASVEDEKRALKMCSERGILEMVDIRPNVTNGEKKLLLQDAQYLLLPSRFEGWGIVAIEAAAAGKMTIGSSISGILNAVRKGETGFLVEAGDVRGFSLKMKMLAADNELRRKHEPICRDWAAKFSWETAVQQHEEYYQVLL
ncbi:MAG: glycosyltransferase [Chitinivibrionales bacterium]|nr:glycosyltransferase [Chitinivibrionales bacterium]